MSPSREKILPQFVALAAWSSLALVAVGFTASAIPVIRDFLASSQPGSAGYITTKTIMIVLVIVLIPGWIATLWHVAENPGLRAGQRAVVIVAVVFGSLASAFFYYFTYLYWARKKASPPAAV